MKLHLFILDYLCFPEWALLKRSLASIFMFMLIIKVRDSFVLTILRATFLQGKYILEKAGQSSPKQKGSNLKSNQGRQ